MNFRMISAIICIGLALWALEGIIFSRFSKSEKEKKFWRMDWYNLTFALLMAINLLLGGIDNYYWQRLPSGTEWTILILQYFCIIGICVAIAFRARENKKKQKDA